jgi:hypothetical protein
MMKLCSSTTITKIRVSRIFNNTYNLPVKFEQLKIVSTNKKMVLTVRGKFSALDITIKFDFSQWYYNCD